MLDAAISPGPAPISLPFGTSGSPVRIENLGPRARFSLRLRQTQGFARVQESFGLALPQEAGQSETAQRGDGEDRDAGPAPGAADGPGGLALDERGDVHAGYSATRGSHTAARPLPRSRGGGPGGLRR